MFTCGHVFTQYFSGKSATGTGAEKEFILLETGDDILLETGDKILKES